MNQSNQPGSVSDSEILDSAAVAAAAAVRDAFNSGKLVPPPKPEHFHERFVPTAVKHLEDLLSSKDDVVAVAVVSITTKGAVSSIEYGADDALKLLSPFVDRRIMRRIKAAGQSPLAALLSAFGSLVAVPESGLSEATESQSPLDSLLESLFGPCENPDCPVHGKAAKQRRDDIPAGQATGSVDVDKG